MDSKGKFTSESADGDNGLVGGVASSGELGFWIRHLVLCAAGGGDVPAESCLVGPNEKKGISVIELPRQQEAEHILADLLELYEDGLRAPLPLFPTASRDHAHARFAEDPASDRWSPEPVPAARKAWEEGFNVPAEREDLFLLQAFRDVDPLAADAELPGGHVFGEVTRRVYLPYLRARRVRP